MAIQKEQIENELKSIIREKGFGDTDTNLESSFEDDLGMDSLDRVEMVMEVEKHFNMSIPDEDSERFTTIGEVVNYLDSALEGRR